MLTLGKSQKRKYKSLPFSAINGLLKAYNVMLRVDRVELFRYKGLNYKRLKGNLKQFESVRCDYKYRLLFKSCLLYENIEITDI